MIEETLSQALRQYYLDTCADVGYSIATNPATRPADYSVWADCVDYLGERIARGVVRQVVGNIETKGE